MSRFDTPVLNSAGVEETTKVTRVGLFNAVQDGQYLQWLPDVQKLIDFGSSARRKDSAQRPKISAQVTVRWSLALDPSRGSILSLLVQTPTLSERLEFGGVIGYIILSLGGLTVFIGLIRLDTIV